MNKTDELQDIKQMIMKVKDCEADEAVNHIAHLVARSKKSVYGWLSRGTSDIPDQMLELLKLKLIN